MSQFIGIDLGTTFSAAARIDQSGRPVIVPNGEGKLITPSVIWFGSDPPTVGEEAKAEQQAGATDVASFFKRSMGDPHFALTSGGKTYTPVDLSALVLAKVKHDCEAYLKEVVSDAVITVPAYFNDAQRQATIRAGAQAGLNVLRIINEPTAAALAYGVHQSGRDEVTLVYDLGGGTFDITLVKITPTNITVLGTDGDHELGGKDWDDRVAKYVSTRFRDEYGSDPLEGAVSFSEILVQCEEAKKKLTSLSTVKVSIDHNGTRGAYELTREKFEELTADLMERTQRLTEQVLKDAQLTWADLTGVLLVGGSTRMPMVHGYVQRMSGKPPRTGVEVDHAVALGAAVQAAMDVQAKRPAGRKLRIAGEKKVQDVTSHSLGVVAKSEDLSRFLNSPIIRRNTPIPAHGEREYDVVHGGAGIECIVYVTEGEGTDPRAVTVRGRYVCRGVAANVPKKTRVAVRYSYDQNATIQVSARLVATNALLDVVQEPVEDLAWLSKTPKEVEAFDPSKLDFVVSPPNFDDIGSILGSLQLPHRAWDGQAPLADILFLNCGSSMLPAAADLRRYVENGGCVYASDLTDDLVQAAFPGLFSFAGRTGAAGVRNADVVDPELRTRIGDSMAVHFDMGGWAELSGVSSDASVLLRDQNTGQPLMAQGNAGDGKVFFTSFHNRSQASGSERLLLQLLVAKQISAVSGVPIEIITNATGITLRPR